jgi:hypothetical protein
VSEFRGTLNLNGTASLDPGNYLLLEGSPGVDPRQAAAIAARDIRRGGLRNGDSVIVTGAADTVGGRPVIWMQSIDKDATDFALVRDMPPAKRSAKKATPKKQAAKHSTKKPATKSAPKKKLAKSASKKAPGKAAKKTAKQVSKVKTPKGKRK